MKTGVIYSITSKLDNKKYIGMSRSVEERWYRHKRKLNKNIHRNVHLQNAWNKYGKYNFKFEIIEEGIPLNKLGEKEKYYIKKYDTFKNGYNRTTGGEKDYKLSEETKRKLSRYFKGENSSTNKITKKQGIEIFNKYHNTKLKYSDLADEYNLCKFTISNIVTCKHWSTRHLEIENPSKTQAKKHSNLTTEIGKEIIEKRNKNNSSYKELAAEYNTNPSTIGEIIRGDHWTTRHLVNHKKKKSKKYCYVDKGLGLKIYKLYHNTKENQNTLADKFNLSQASIWNIVNCRHKSTKHLKE